MSDFDTQPRQTARAAVITAARGGDPLPIEQPRQQPAEALPEPSGAAAGPALMQAPSAAARAQDVLAQEPRRAARLGGAEFEQRLDTEMEPSGVVRYGAAVSGNLDNRLYRGLVSRMRDEFPPDPEWQVPWAKVNELPRSEGAALAQARSQAEYDSIMRDIEEDNERVQTIMRGGTISGIALMFAGEATSISAYLAPTLALRTVAGRIAAATLANQRGRALGMGAAAGGLADLGLEAGVQALEGQIDPGSAVLAGALGASFGTLDAALISRAVNRLRPAIEQSEQDAAMRMALALDRLGEGATPEALRAEADRIATDQLRRPITAAVSAVANDRKLFDEPEDAEAPRQPDDDTVQEPAPGMVRLYHGGEPDAATGDVWFTKDLRDATGWASRSPDMTVSYVDVPANSLPPDDAAFGVIAPQRLQLPPEIANQRKPLQTSMQGPAFNTVTVKTAIEQALESPALKVVNEVSRATRHLLTHLQNILPEGVLNKVTVSFDGNVRGNFNGITGAISAPGASGSTLSPEGAGGRNDANVLAHEVVHAATSRIIAAVRDNVPGVTEGSVRAVQRLEQIRLDLDKHLRDKGVRRPQRETGADYAASDLDEFVAQVMSDPETRKALSEMPGGGFKNMLSAFADAVVRLLGLDPKTTDSALREAVALVEKLIKEGENPPGMTAANFIKSRPGLQGPRVAMPSTVEVDGVQRPTVNSQGQPIASSLEGVQNFWRWFGDSKVVDSEGRPLVVYTGTSKDVDFDKFKVPKNGAWFTTDPAVASSYAKDNDSRDTKYNPATRSYEELNTASRVIPAYLKIAAPATLSDADSTAMRMATNYRKVQGQIFDRLRLQGHDGVDLGDGVFVVVGAPTQIKSAIGNRGTFSPTNASILQGPRADAQADEVTQFMQDPVAQKYGLTSLPMGTDAERADAKMMLGLARKAESWAAKNPMDEAWIKRADQLIDNNLIPAASTGLRLLKSQNPVARMIAAELLEDASRVGQAKSSTAAISKYLHEAAFMGNTLPVYNDAYSVWRNRNGGHIGHELIGRDFRNRFDRLVAEEIEARRQTGKPASKDGQVRQATDAVEAAYNRIRVAQKDNRTLGWQALPETSTGYMPHHLSPNKWLELTLAQRQALHQALVDQFVSIEGWDITFSDQLAARYLARVRERATNGHVSPVGGASSGSAEIIEDALKALGMSEDEVRKQMARFTRGAASWTKKRLELDLLKVHEIDGQRVQLMDVFDTDQISLLRQQAGRASGEVALARHGIYGRPHMELIRRLINLPGPDLRVTARESDAFNQVAAEFINAPFGTAEPKWMENARTLTSAVRLGGMGWTQFGEYINGIPHVGSTAVLSSIGQMGRLKSEVNALVRGEKVDNPLLGSIEHFSGVDFGTDAYKIVMPFDVPDHAYPTYGNDTVTVFDRLVRGASYASGKLSFWRAIHSVQQRGMAEQIVAKIAKFSRDGKNDVALQQFRVTPEMREAIVRDGVAEFDQHGSLVRFDITKLQDPVMREDLVQAVHRGVRQIIQGTFIGETGKWAHEGWLKMLMQFRTFPLTAVEKQWARQRNDRGAWTALGILVGSMSVAAPVYIARTYATSIGREDQEEFLEQRLQPEFILRATLNYVALAGFAGDFLDAAVALAPDELGLNITGGRAGADTNFVGNLIAPSTALVNDAWVALQNLDNPHQLLQVLPGSRLPYVIPLLNTLRE